MKKSVKFGLLPAIFSMAILAGCGGGGGSSSSSTGSSGSNGSGGSGSGSTPVNNTAALIVDQGPPAAGGDNDIAFTTVTVCVPGTATCQAIDHVQVDTGSEGLRLPTGVLNSSLSLAQQTTFECLGFADGTFVWGPLATADIQIAGEVAHSVPIQLASSSLPPASANNAGCTTATGGGLSSNQIFSVPQFGANGIIGVGVFRQDCGQGCVGGGSGSIYFNCSTAACPATPQSLTAQLQNPVWMFPQDNNGVILQLPSVSANGQVSATGSIIFGIGTQSNNGIGSASAIVPSSNTGNFAANFKGTVYNDVNAQGPGGSGGAAFIDSGSNGLFFLDSATLTNTFGISMPDCPSSGSQPLPGFYCPASTTTIPGGSSGLTICSESSNCIAVASGRPVTLNVANGVSLIYTPNTAFSNLAGDSSNTFDLGLPFFFGQSVYFGIEGQSTPLGTGPLYAF